MEKTIRDYFIIGTICLIAGAGITGIITGRQLHNLRESEAAVVSSIAELKRQNQELSDSIGAIGEGLNKCTGTVAAVGGAIQCIGGTVQQLGASVDAIKRDIGQIKSGQSDINTKLSEFNNSLSNLGQSIHGLAEPIHNATTGVQQASDELSGANEIIDTATGILQGLPKASQNSTK